MNAAPTRPVGGVADEAPATIPQTPPPNIGYGHPEYVFVQAIMEMQKSLGEINASILSLREAINSTKAKVDSLVDWKNRLIGGVVVLSAVVSVLTLVIVKGLDYVTIRAPSTQSQQVSPTPQAPQAPSSVPKGP